MTMIGKRLAAGLMLAGIIATAPAIADVATLVDQGVLVETGPVSGTPATSASYISSGGYAVSNADYIDAHTMVFDMNSTTSVVAATLRVPVEVIFPQNGAAPIEVYYFSDDGALQADDYSLGFGSPIAEVNAIGLTEVAVDVTGPVNAALNAGRFIGFRIKSAVDPGAVSEELFPAFTGVKFRNNPILEFVPGAAPTLSGGATSFDGYTLQVPTVEVPSFGEISVQLRLVNPNTQQFELTAAALTGGSSTPAVSGSQLLDCSAFSPPQNTGVAAGVASYSISSGILDVPSIDYNGSQLAIRLEYEEGSAPWTFETLAIGGVQSGPSDALVSALGGGLLVEPSQDFVSLCHGWVIIGDLIRNRVVERNLITGDTGKTYSFNTAPDQFTLDPQNNRIFMTVHPESERLYRLELDSGVIGYNHISATVNGQAGDSYTYSWALRDVTLGENGNVFALLYDGELVNPESTVPFTETGLWLGLMNRNASFLVEPTPLLDPVRIEYDPVQDHVFLATASNLATFNFDVNANTYTAVPGTDVAVGASCTDFDVSPDGNRLAYTCPAGNYSDGTSAEPDFSVVDMNPENYFNNDGEWFFGESPVSATFNANGTLLIGTDNDKLYVFDVKTHLILEDYELGLLPNESIRKIRISRDGEYIYLFLNNDIHAENSKFYWMPMPDITGSPL